jgi:UDP-N-acetylmuramate dehydrogenase
MGIDTLTGAPVPIERGFSLKGLTSFRIGGSAEFYSQPQSVEDLRSLLRFCTRVDVPVRILGGGSNVLVCDEGVRGLVIQLCSAEFRQVQSADGKLRVGAGVPLGRAIAMSIGLGLSGLEVLAGVPGTIGGAIFGNSGGREGDIGQCVAGITVLDQDGHIAQLERQGLQFGYRSSGLGSRIVVSADLALHPGDPDHLREVARRALQTKSATQPLRERSGGCVFKNPRGISARTLIQRCGLDGTTIGGAEISSLHQNFITVHPGTSTSDVLRLIDYVRTRVSTLMNVELELELDIWK